MLQVYKKIETHVNRLSRQQRAKQGEARHVDVNLNYGQPRNGGINSRQQQQQSLPAGSTVEDFF